MPISKAISTNNLLKNFINPTTGWIDYQKLKNDYWLTDRINEWEKMDISDFSLNKKLAFWLNAYNIFTLKGVLIELTKNPRWEGNLSIWSK